MPLSTNDINVNTSEISDGTQTGDSASENQADNNDSSTNNTDSNGDQGTGSTEDQNTDNNNSDADTGTNNDSNQGNSTDAAGENTNDTDENNATVTTDATASGNDLSGGEDDSPTQTESLSLVGPFIKDTNRSAGPPSVPTGLTQLLSGENWIEFSWVPSTDDQSVEAYEIYRDGSLIYTVRGDTNYEFDYRSWISTSYMDCNYTRYTDCESKQPVSGRTYAYTVAAVDNQGMRSAQSEPAYFSTATRQSSPVNLDQYALVLNEEFNGSALDRNTWKTSLPWGPEETINGERQYFVNTFGSNPPNYDPFVFTGSTLQITGKETPSELVGQVNGKEYVSGVITTSDNFKMTYGYVEMSAKLASGTGILSTFYMFNQDYEKNKPEIDIIEYIGDRPEKAYQTYHYFDSNRARYFSGERHSSPTMETVYSSNLSSEYHRYAVLWEKELVVWYIDGIEVRRIEGKRVSDEPMNIIAQLLVGSEWIGNPDSAALPAVLEIDYIRAWQKNN